MLAFVDGVVQDLGSADIMVANAGVSTLGSIFDLDAADWSETVDTNLTGVFNALRAVAPHMRRQRWGRIIAISSMMGRSANPSSPPTAPPSGASSACQVRGPRWPASASPPT